MFRGLFTFILALGSLATTAQQSPALKRELDSILVTDQQYRALMGPDMAVKADSLARVFGVSKEDLPMHLWKLQSRSDSLNIIRIEAIIKEYGYPGKSLVGTPTNEAVFYVLQHSEVIDRYLPVVKEAAEKGELPFHLYAMMLDRSLMYAGKEQVYGTQGSGFTWTNPETGKQEMKMIIWPIQDPAGVNARRKEAGFTLTVEENAKRLGIPYQVFTLEEVRKMKGK
ncbi:MAG TPA: DUF6624 domain-containing protein [Chitinophagaceae bacterium]|jgi:hypothetical protein|nr:DUF6624 domain-containing protein [Chitinophagaceae bacterium]